MPLIDLLPTSLYGNAGNPLPFSVLPTPPNSRHIEGTNLPGYSIDGTPTITLRNSGVGRVPPPSRLDELDSNNNNKWKSTGPRYYR